MKEKCDIRYWLWLQAALGAGARFKEIIEHFSSPEALYRSNVIEWRMCPALTAAQIDRLSSTSLKDVEKILYECERHRWNMIAYDDARYPEALRQIANPPAVLYTDGEPVDFNRFATVSIVGTRKASTYARKAAYLMAKGLALCNAVVISGGALGVDSAAHNGALDAGKPTYAVLGNGLGYHYLRSNDALRARIKEAGGALITEYPPFTPASRTTFPMRNRIISALSDGVLVVEAGVKSGSLITAQFAAEQGKDIFAIPASILDYHFQGTNKLIDDGAAVATSPSIVLERYANTYESLDLSALKTFRELEEDGAKPAANEPRKKQLTFDTIKSDRAERLKTEEKAMALSGDEKTVYDCLTFEFENAENIVQKCALDAKRVLTALTMLELKGIAESTSGKRYRKK